MTAVEIARRTFLLGTTAIAGGLAVGYYVTKPNSNPLQKDLGPSEVAFAPYVKINSDNEITVIVPRTEMGQGVHTTLAALVAEELDVMLEQINVEPGPVDKTYYNAAVLEELAPFVEFDQGIIAGAARAMKIPAGKLLGMQITAGSSSVKDGFEKMRFAGAAVRAMLVSAAAKNWNSDARTFITENGSVTEPVSGNSATYGELSESAAKLDIPENVTLKPRSQWKILGKSLQRVDFLDKATGVAKFGADIQLPEMLYGTVKISPHIGAKPTRVDDRTALEIPGVIKVIPIDLPQGAGFGIVAKSTWAAFKGAEALEIEWGESVDVPENDAMFATLKRKLEEPADFALRDVGNTALAFADAPRSEIVEAQYTTPLLAHACLEPMNATVQVRNGLVEIWTASQAPTVLQSLVANSAEVDVENVRVNTTLCGGSFGRRLESDFALYALELAKQTQGQPINVVWTRHEDMTHDLCRPPAIANMRARIKPRRLPEAVDIAVSSPSVLASFMKRTYPDWFWAGADKMLTAGAHDQPYAIENYRVAAHQCDLGLPVGFWRSNGPSFNTFFQECFLDEVAQAGHIDALGMRLRLMAGHPSAIKVLQKVSDMSGWGRDLQSGKGLGLAQTFSFGTWVAQVIEVTDDDGLITIDKVWCAVDIGQALDPEIVKSQISSGIIFGLSSAIDQEITYQNGEVQQRDFSQFDALRMNQCPEIEIELVESGGPLGGAGEAGTPPSVPALVNAIYSATGKRVRNLPLSRQFRFA